MDMDFNDLINDSVRGKMRNMPFFCNCIDRNHCCSFFAETNISCITCIHYHILKVL